jgi:hypothetical protein
MKPQVLEIQDTDGKRHAWLVNPARAFTANDRETGRPALHYAGAVDLGETRNGIVRICQENGALLNPRPCVAVFTGKPATNSLAWLGVSEKSAAALLQLAAAGTNPQPDFATDAWTFGGPREKGVPLAWQDHAWIIAWRVNWWNHRAMNAAGRIADLASLGIEIQAGTLRQKLRRLGLVTARPR